MKNKLFSLFICIILALAAFPADSAAASVISLDDLICAAADYKQSRYDSDLESAFAENAGISNLENYVIALSKYGGYDFADYAESAEAYVKSAESLGAVEKQRFALAQSILGTQSAIISETLDTTVGELGIMSYIWGLILADASNADLDFRNEIIETLLSLELDGGGWALSGQIPDSDVTAMAITALSPYKADDSVSAALERGVDFLSKKQTENGDVIGWGGANCESTAQTIIALCALNIDASSDERFVKNSKTLLDGLLVYRCESGGFMHVSGGDENDYASSQALCALVSLWLFENDLPSIYSHTEASPLPSASSDSSQEISDSLSESESAAAVTASAPSDEHTESPTAQTENKNPFNLKSVLYIVIFSLLFLAVIISALRKKLSIRKIVVWSALCLAACAAVFLADIKTPDEYYTDSVNDSSAEFSAYISIRAGAARQDGEILPRTQITFSDGDSVYDILLAASKENKIALDVTGAGDGVYVRGIDYLYEYDCGELSGWMYYVNGISASKGCAAYKACDGDEIEFFYTLTLGENAEEERK